MLITRFARVAGLGLAASALALALVGGGAYNDGADPVPIGFGAPTATPTPDGNSPVAGGHCGTPEHPPCAERPVADDPDNWYVPNGATTPTPTPPPPVGYDNLQTRPARQVADEDGGGFNGQGFNGLVPTPTPTPTGDIGGGAYNDGPNSPVACLGRWCAGPAPQTRISAGVAPDWACGDSTLFCLPGS